jgi:hypothetical protein
VDADARDPTRLSSCNYGTHTFDTNALPRVVHVAAARAAGTRTVALTPAVNRFKLDAEAKSTRDGPRNYLVVPPDSWLIGLEQGDSYIPFQCGRRRARLASDAHRGQRQDTRAA